MLVSLLLLILACSQQVPQRPIIEIPAKETATEKVAEKVIVVEPKGNPIVNIISPNDGALIKSSNVTIELRAENFKITPVGAPVKEREGHFHVWLDSEKRVGPDKMVTFENVVSGKHAIVAELVRSDHSSLNPRITKTITIDIESDYIPQKIEPQQGITEFTVETDDSGFYPNTLKAKTGDKVRINFKFRDSSIYYAGLDVKGPFEDIKYELKGEQPITREFSLKEETRITSYWPASGVKKGTLIIQADK